MRHPRPQTPGPARRRWRGSSEDGFTFPEFTIAASAMLIVAVAAMGMLMISFRQNDNQEDRVVALDEARNGLIHMTSEVRSAAGLNSVSAQVLDVLVHVPDDTSEPYHWVRYKCVGNNQGNSQGLGGTCSRQDKTIHSGGDCAADGSGAGCVVILRNVVKNDTDSFAEPCENGDPASTDERQFCVKDNRTVQFSVWVEVPEAVNPIELRGAATVRNCMNQQEEVIPCVDTT
jgi:hypothetical protein